MARINTLVICERLVTRRRLKKPRDLSKQSFEELVNISAFHAGPCRDRLLDLGINLDFALNIIDSSNSTPFGSCWPLIATRETIKRLWSKFERFDLIWAVGREITHSILARDSEPLNLYSLPEGPGRCAWGPIFPSLSGTREVSLPLPIIGVLPYPSKSNRWWKNDWNVEIAKDFVEETKQWVSKRKCVVV